MCTEFIIKLVKAIAHVIILSVQMARVSSLIFQVFLLLIQPINFSIGSCLMYDTPKLMLHAGAYRFIVLFFEPDLGFISAKTLE